MSPLATHRSASGVLIVLGCAAVLALSACTDGVEPPAPAPAAPTETRREEPRPTETRRTEPHPTESRTTAPTPPTTTLTEYPPTSCPPGLVC